VQTHTEVTFFDSDEIKAIERVDRSHPGIAGWSEADFSEFFRQANHAALVYKLDGYIVGYLAYTVKPRKNEVIIERLMVHHDHCRQGVATKLLTEVKARAARNPGARIEMLVHERQLALQQLLKKAGFTAREVKRGHFADQGEDAYAFVLQIGRPVNF
jgi:ribosomal protein S18 acetylase RimI-like enzyme